MADINESLNIASNIVNAVTTNQTEKNNTTTNTEVTTDQLPVETTPTTTDTPVTPVEEAIKPTDTTTQPITTTPETETPSITTSTPITTSSNTQNNAAYLKQIYAENPTLYGYATKQGFGIYNYNGQLYVNNTAVDWKSLGLKQDAKGNIVGTQAQLDQLLKNVTSAGYTSSKAISPYLTSMGMAKPIQVNGSVWNIGGKLVDFSQYANLGMKIVNNAWVGPESAYKKIIKDLSERSSDTLDQYVSKQGMTYQRDSKNPGQYINNLYVSDATLKGYGLSSINGKLVGSQANFDKLISDVKGMGYTSNKTLQEYVQPVLGQFKYLGGSQWSIGGKFVDLSKYKGLKIENGTWKGSEEAYKQLIADLQSQSKVDMVSYLKSKGLDAQSINGQLYINNKPMTTAELNSLGINGVNGAWWSSETNYNSLISQLKQQGYSTNQSFSQYATSTKTALKHVSGNVWTVNGKLVDLSKYDGMQLVNGGWVGSETAYKQILDDVNNRAAKDFTAYAQSTGMGFKVVDGQMIINNMPMTTQLLNQFGITGIDGKWYGTQADYNAMVQYIKDQGYTTNKSLSDYLVAKGLSKPIKVTDNVWNVGGKLVVFDSKTFTDLGLKVMNDAWVGSETAYKKILDYINTQSSDTFDTYASKKGFNYEYKNGKYYVNGYLVDSKDINASGLKIMTNKIVGTEAQYDALIKKIEEPYTYKSALEDEIQTALDQINEFQQYQTPQETLDLINQLMASAQETFNYDPASDSALVTAQKEAERQVRESKGAAGLLFSSGTVETVARKAAELIPTFEQAAYQRFADEKNRAMTLMNTVMQWDEMQNDRNVDELNLIKTKFDTIMEMDSRALEQFQQVLTQQNADREAALAQQQYDLDKKTAEIEAAWERVNATGTVTKADSIILGVPVGTKASWLQQIELQQKYALSNLKIEYENAIKLQKSQKEIEAALIKYKSALDYASSQKLQSAEQKADLALQQKEYQNQLKLLK